MNSKTFNPDIAGRLQLRSRRGPKAHSRSFDLDLNVLPEAYRRGRISKRQVFCLLLAVASITIVVILYQAATGAMARTSELQDERDYLQQRVTQKGTMISTVEEYHTITGKRGFLTDDVAAIQAAAMQAGIQVTYIQHTGSKVTATCQVPYILFPEFRLALEEFSTALVQTGRFSAATYPGLSAFPPGDVVLFEITTQR